MSAVNVIPKSVVEKIQRVAYYTDNVLPKIASTRDRRRIYKEAQAVVEEARAFAATSMTQAEVKQRRKALERLVNNFIARNMND